MFNEQRQPPLTLKEAILDANWDENSHAIEGVDGRMMTHGQLRSFLFDRLACFKVPTRIIFVKEILKGATGKTNRADMARALGLL